MNAPTRPARIVSHAERAAEMQQREPEADGWLSTAKERHVRRPGAEKANDPADDRCDRGFTQRS